MANYTSIVLLIGVFDYAISSTSGNMEGEPGIWKTTDWRSACTRGDVALKRKLFTGLKLVGIASLSHCLRAAGAHPCGALKYFNILHDIYFVNICKKILM